MKKLFFICLTVIGFAFAANAQVCKTEGQSCVTKEGDRGVCRNTTVTQTTSSTSGISNSASYGSNSNAQIGAKVGTQNNNVSLGISGNSNSSTSSSKSSQSTTTTTRSWNQLYCTPDDDGAAKATPIPNK